MQIKNGYLRYLSYVNYVHFYFSSFTVTYVHIYIYILLHNFQINRTKKNTCIVVKFWGATFIHGPTLWSTRRRCCICITDTRFTKRLKMNKFSVNSWSWFVVVEVGVLCRTSTPPSPPPITSSWSIPTVLGYNTVVVRRRRLFTITRTPLLRFF